MNDTSPAPDPTHTARVRLLSAAIAQRILAIPPDVSEQSRAVRIGKVRQKVDDWADWMAEHRIYRRGVTAIVTYKHETEQWWQAKWAAWDAVKAALDAGDDLTAFLFPSETPVA